MEGKKPEEAKKPAEEEKKEEAVKMEEKKDDKKEEEKKSQEPKAEQPPPPPTPQEIILRVYMHCEGCARKVRRCLKGFEGVENVITDCRISKVVVKGEKADPLKVLERVQKKSHRQVELISPIPKPPAEEPKKPEEKEVVKPEEKKEEPPVVTVVLGVYMHCEACAQGIKKRIQRMKGVQNVEPNQNSSQVMVKGVFDPEKLVDYLYKRTGKHAVIVKVEPEKKEKEKWKGVEEGKKEEKGKGVEEAKKVEENGKENKESGTAASGGGGEQPAKPEAEMEDSKLELKKNEFYPYYSQNYQVYPQRYDQDLYPQNYQVYPQRYDPDLYAYPPQMFSDENPNACSVM